MKQQNNREFNFGSGERRKERCKKEGRVREGGGAKKQKNRGRSRGITQPPP